MKSSFRSVALIPVLLVALSAWPDSLELKNGSLIRGKFAGATENEISFQVGSSLQKYNISDVVSVKFDSAAPVSDMPTRPKSSPPRDAGKVEPVAAKSPALLVIPAGTRISVRTIDGIDSTKNHVGDRFQASLEEPLTVDGNVIVDKGADVYGRLAESKTSGTFAGQSQLRLELTGLVVGGQTVPLVTGEYELLGKSRGDSTVKRTVGVGVVGTVIGAIAGGAKGAAIGATTGAAAGAGSEIITKGDQVKIPSETLLEFTLQQDLSMPAHGQ
jgi:hypothetical protein